MISIMRTKPTSEIPDSHSDTQLIVRELFWQHSVELLIIRITGDHYLDITLGKMRLDWGCRLRLSTIGCD